MYVEGFGLLTTTTRHAGLLSYLVYYYYYYYYYRREVLGWKSRAIECWQKRDVIVMIMQLVYGSPSGDE